VRLAHEIPATFALNQALSPFAYAALDLFDPTEPGYAHDVVSVVEATLDSPRQVLAAQENRARGEAVAAMKAEGMEYDERMALLVDVTYPKPLAEPLAAAFAAYRTGNPWVADLEISPKSIVREMHERAATFAEYVSQYGLDRTEGVLLRYLADAYRALRQTVPPERGTEDLDELTDWLGDLVRRTDSSLLDEWERLAHPDDGTPRRPDEEAPAPPLSGTPRVLRALVRGSLFRRVELLARGDWFGLERLGDADEEGVAWTADRWQAALEPYWDEHDDVGIAAAARGPALFQVTEGPTTWVVRQVLDDPARDHDWRIEAVVDLPATDENGEVRLAIRAVGPL
jgi:hypothetical protein